VSATERLGWPPAQRAGARISGQNHKRRAAMDFKIQQGSINGGAQVWPGLAVSFAKLGQSCATGKRAENGPKVRRGICILAGY